VTFDDGFRNVLENAVPGLVERNMPATVFVPSGNLGRTPDWWMSDGSADANERVVTAEEVRAVIATELVSIGSHAVSHRALTALCESDLDHELCASRAGLETLTGRPVEALAFPYGAYDERVLAHARRAGYTRAFTIEATVHRADADEFLMGRVRVEPDDWPVEVWLKLRGGYQWLALLHRLRPGRGDSETW
jgi:peptidoglycan/xylan/chitin deacetylase (PgdA/CDA1 family)